MQSKSRPQVRLVFSQARASSGLISKGESLAVQVGQRTVAPIPSGVRPVPHRIKHDVGNSGIRCTRSGTGMNLECSSIFCNLTAFLVVVQSIEENKLQVFVNDQRVLVLVCVQLLSDTIDGPRFWDDLWRCTANR